MRHGALVALLILMPALAFAQATSASREILASYDLVAPTGVAHVEEIAVDGHHQTRCVVTTNEGLAEVTFDGRTIRLSDGYSIVRTTLAKTSTALVTRLTANAPDGKSATAILALNLATGQTAFAGFEGYTALIHRSHDIRIANRVLPLVVQQHAAPFAIDAPSETGGGATSGRLRVSALRELPRFKAAPTDCASSSLAFMGAALAVEIYCLSEVEPNCLLSLMGLTSAAYSMSMDCGYYTDNTIGW
jgi:hypothetical protein